MLRRRARTLCTADGAKFHGFALWSPAGDSPKQTRPSGLMLGPAGTRDAGDTDRQSCVRMVNAPLRHLGRDLFGHRAKSIKRVGFYALTSASWRRLCRSQSHDQTPQNYRQYP